MFQFSLYLRDDRRTLVGQSSVQLDQRRASSDFIQGILATGHTADSNDGYRAWKTKISLSLYFELVMCPTTGGAALRRRWRSTFGEAVHLSHCISGEVFERLTAEPAHFGLVMILKRLRSGHGGVGDHQAVNSQLRTERRNTQWACIVQINGVLILRVAPVSKRTQHILYLKNKK